MRQSRQGSRRLGAHHSYLGRHSKRVSAGLRITLLSVLAGCAAPPKSRTAPPPMGMPVAPTAPPVVPTSRPDAMDANGASGATDLVAQSSPSIIAQRTQEYIKSMQPALARKKGTPPFTSSAAAPVTPLAGSTGEPQLASAQSGAVPAAAIPPVAGQSAVQWEDPSRLSLNPMMLQGSTSVVMPPPQPQQSQAQPSAVEHAQTLANTPSTIEPPSNQMAVAPPVPPSHLVSNAATPQQDSLGQQLSGRVHDYPHDVSAQLDYQLERFVTDQAVPDLGPLAALPSEDSDLLAAVMDGLANFRNGLRQDGNMLMSRKVAPLLDAADRIRSHSGLIMPAVRLCTDVTGYGIYKPFEGDPPHFDAGKATEFILYCEVANFASDQPNGQEWRTNLKQTLMLYSDQGTPEWKEVTKSWDDLSRSRRHDFFMADKYWLPATLSAGRHLLKVSIEDAQTRRFAETTVPLLVVAAPAN